VVNALRDHDARLAEEIDSIRLGLGREGAVVGRRPDKIVFDLPAGVSQGFVQAFDARLVDRCSSSFYFWLGLLQNYAARERHALVSHSYREGDFRLGPWVSVQRVDYKRGELSPERVAALEAIDGWDWDLGETAFQTGLAHLKTYAVREGHAVVPQGYREGDFRLGHWVSTQRTAYKATRLSPERVAVLEAIDGWDWDPLETAFQTGLAHLKTYAAREGHAVVPTRYRAGDYALGTWVRKQRTAYNQVRLSPERIAALKAIDGWVWRVLT
jgi:hypothetical protein